MKFIYKILMAGFLLTGVAACTDEFDEVNTDPALVTTPELRHLLTHSLFQLGDYQYTEWFYDNYQYLQRYSQATVFRAGNSQDFNNLGATGGRYGTLYGGVMQNLVEIRRRIDAMNDSEKAKYQKFRAVTFIPQVMQGIKVTDWYGSIPYAEAMKGRYESSFAPAYDNQEKLFDTWVAELTDAADILSSDLADQAAIGNQDFIYQGDFDKWAKLANTLKMRIAVRLLNTNEAKAKQIMEDVLSSAAGIIETEDDQLAWQPGPQYRGRAGDFWGAPVASKNLMDFMRENQDPRTRFYFEKNDFSQDVVDLLTAEGKTMPSFVNDPVNDDWDRYQGGPVSPDRNSEFDYYGIVKDNANTTYNQLSHINRRFFAPGFDNGTGYYIDVMFSAAEASLYVAEFIEKGLITGQGTAKEWYDKGVELSLTTNNWIAEKAIISNYEDLKLKTAEVATLLAQPDYALDGTNNLEKIYLQQYINFFKLPNELSVTSRRTGYPKKTSTLLPWESVMASGIEIPLPRRFTIGEPTIEYNRENWAAAMQEQGFTHGENIGSVLNAERVWWDKASPNYGEGL